MEPKRTLSDLPKAAGKVALHGLCLALAIAVAMPEQLPAATLNVPKMPLTFTYSDSLAKELMQIHCCHAHPLPPYDNYCCHAGAAVVVGAGAYGAYYGAAGVRGTARRTSRRTSRRVSRRR